MNFSFRSNPRLWRRYAVKETEDRLRIAQFRANAVRPLRPKWKYTVHTLLSRIASSREIGCKSLTRRHVQYCIHTHTHGHTHLHVRQFHVKRLLGPGTKRIPSKPSWSRRKIDLKTTFPNNLIAPNKRDAVFKNEKRKNKKKKTKGSPTYPKKAFWKLLPLHSIIPNNYHRSLHSLESHHSRFLEISTALVRNRRLHSLLRDIGWFARH